jgi:hypothetical protein
MLSGLLASSDTDSVEYSNKFYSVMATLNNILDLYDPSRIVSAIFRNPPQDPPQEHPAPSQSPSVLDVNETVHSSGDSSGEIKTPGTASGVPISRQQSDR